MKSKLIIIFSMLLMLSCNTEKDIHDLKLIEGVAYLKNNPSRPYTGKVAYYSKDKKLIMEGNYYNGIKEGDWIYFDDVGNITSKSNFSEGKLIKETRFDIAGNIIFSQLSNDNGRTLKFKEFDPNGNLRKTGTFIEGDKYGKWITYDDYGKEILTEYFDTLFTLSSEIQIDSSKPNPRYNHRIN